MTRKCTRWTALEDAALRASWPRGGMAAARCRLPDRTDAAIYSRVRTLKVRVAWDNVSRKRPECFKGHDVSPMDIAFWLSTWVLSPRPAVPSRDRIMERWGVNRATAYRWIRWAKDKLEQIQAREGIGHADD